MTQAPDPDGIEGEVVERLGEFTEDLPAERVMLNRALGGWRGIPIHLCPRSPSPDPLHA